MNQHNQHGHGHQHKHESAPAKRGLHQDWRLWTAVVLMLAAIAAYILSGDEEFVPGEQDQPDAPAERMPAE